MTEGKIAPTGRARRRRRRHKRDNGVGRAAPVQGPGASAGTPRFLQAPKPAAADRDSAAEREARTAAAMPGPVTERPTTTPLGRAAAAAVSADSAPGKPLKSNAHEKAGARSEYNPDTLRVHPDSQLAASFGANAVTYGGHIHFAPGAYRPGTPKGDALISHELVHVAQQGRFGTTGAQFDLAQGGMDTGSGWFDIDMRTNTDALSRTGLEGTITFTPSADAPYSNRIGMIQTVDFETIDASGVSSDFDWSATAEANRENVKTPTGEFVDMVHASQPATRESEPWYWENAGAAPEVATSINHFGWNRGGGDLHDAQLRDFPRYDRHAEYDFETVALGRDSETVYGALNWGFEVDGAAGTVSNEHAVQSFVNTSGPGVQHQSAEFEEAREEFREFYIHEPEIVYFDTDQAIPLSGELDKLADAGTYMAANPDVDIELSGSADTRGSPRDNRALALSRMDAVQGHLILLGVDPARIHRDEVTAGESSAQGDQGPLAGSAGSLLANRRVTVRYQRMMSLP